MMRPSGIRMYTYQADCVTTIKYVTAGIIWLLLFSLTV